VEAYVDDVVIKTENSKNFIEDLQLVLNSLQRYRWKLNLEKCVFGVPAGKLLGFIVSHRGIEANPKKIEAIMRMEAPRSQKKVQRLTGCMAALSRFISRLGEKGLSFYKLLKKVDKFQWTSEAQEALDALKKFLTTPPVLKPPRRATPIQPAKDLLLYISCTTHVVSTLEEEIPSSSEIIICSTSNCMQAPSLLRRPQSHSSHWISDRGYSSQ
jgi:hypothetical protein